MVAGLFQSELSDRLAVTTSVSSLLVLCGVSEDVAREAFRLAAHKLPIKTKFVVGNKAGQLDAEAGGEIDE